jgi:hypothetical protein
MRKALGLLAVLGAVIGGLAYLQRTRGEGRERVDLYFDDGSTVSLSPSSSDAQRLMPLARRVLASARG